MFRTGILTAAVVLAVAAGGVAADDKKADNPEYTSWAKFKPGTTTKMKMTTEVNGMKSETVIGTKLVEVAADKLVLEVETESVVMGRSFKAPATKRDVPKQVTTGATGTAVVPPPGKKPEGSTEEGAETLKVSGTEFKTKWHKYKSKASGVETEGQVWMSDDVPNGMVKMVSKSAAFSSTMELVEFVKK